MTAQHHALTVGALRCTVVSDLTLPNTVPLDLDRLAATFPDLDRADLESAVAASGMSSSRSALNLLYVEAGDRRVLVDTGMGLDAEPPMGQGLRVLESLGVDLAAIDTVILTHAHGDHFLGLTAPDGTPTFPDARLVVWHTEWAHWSAPETLAALNEGYAAMIRARLLSLEGRMTLIDSAETEVAPGIRLLPLPGHTPGHVGLWLESEGERLLHLVDAVHFPLQLENLDWGPRFDSDSAQAAQTRRAIIGQAAREDLRVLTYHLPFPGLGRFQARDGGRFAWVPEV